MRWPIVMPILVYEKDSLNSCTTICIDLLSLINLSRCLEWLSKLNLYLIPLRSHLLPNKWHRGYNPANHTYSQNPILPNPFSCILASEKQDLMRHAIWHYHTQLARIFITENGYLLPRLRTHPYQSFLHWCQYHRKAGWKQRTAQGYGRPYSVVNHPVGVPFIIRCAVVQLCCILGCFDNSLDA